MEKGFNKTQLPRCVPKYRQSHDDNTCGPVCVRMVIDYFWGALGKRTSKQDVHKILQITMNGNKYLSRGAYREHLISALREFGISETEISGNTATRLGQLTRAIEKGRPAILTCLADFGQYGRMGHYVVLTGIDKDFIYLNDPYPGKPSQIPLLSFLKNGQPINWGNSKWGIILNPSSKKLKSSDFPKAIIYQKK